MLFAGWDPLSNILTRTPTYEKIALLHALYAPFMHGCRMISQFVFVDLEAQLHFLLLGILESNKEVLVSLEQVIQAVDKRKGGGGGGVQTAASGATTGGNLATASGVEASVLRGDESLPLAARMKRRADAEARLQQAQQAKAGKGIPSWIWMIGLYVVFNYLLK